MASTINATTNGIVTIGDSVATLALQTGGTTAVAIDTAQIVTLSKSLALLGSTSGSVTIAAPAVAGSTTITLPATSGTLLQSGTAVTVAQGGTGLTAGTSGGIPYYSGASAITSSAALTQYGVVYGGGVGAAPVATAAGTTGQFLGANTSGAPTWQTPAGGGSAATPTALGTVYGSMTTSGASPYLTALGYNAATVVTGTENVAVGYNALNLTTSPNGNTAVGANAMPANLTGAFNAAFGRNAMLSCTSGSNNTALGVYALGGLLTGSNNTAIGLEAGGSLTTGRGNCVLSSYTSLGSNLPVFVFSTQDDRVAIGSSAVTNAYIQVAWTVVSDARDKTDFQAIPHGLSFVQKLNPVSFYFKQSRDSDVKTGIKRYGFKAQEILALEGGDAVIIDNENPDKLRYNGEALVPVLVKAMQELSAALDAANARIAALEVK
jgi:hypothetical protein